MRNLFLFLSVCSISVFVCAEVITFDDYTTEMFDTITGNYQGLIWDQVGVFRSDFYTASGYNNGNVSGEYVAYNLFSNIATVSQTLFHFQGAYLTAAWNDGLTIDIKGYLNGSEIYSETKIVDTSGPTWFDFDFVGVDQITFESYGGTHNPAFTEDYGEHFVLEDFTFTLPEPASLGFLTIGAMALRRKRKRLR